MIGRCRWTRRTTVPDDIVSVKLAPVVGAAVAMLVAVPATASSALVTGNPHCRGGVLHPVGTATTAYAAVAGRAGADAYRKPGGRCLAHFRRLNVNRYPTTFSIVGAIVTRTCSMSWYRVKLPMRPNGITGY